MKFAAIADWADSHDYPVSFMCRQTGVSRSGYYAWRASEPSAHARTDQTLTALITAISAQARGNPGVRRVHAALVALGHRLSRKRVWRLMKAAGLQGRHPRAWRSTTTDGALVEQGASLSPDHAAGARRLGDSAAEIDGGNRNNL